MPSLYDRFLQPSVFDECHEPSLLLAHFAGHEAGIFVDVGANDPVTSVSQPFENLGWKGLIFEPLPESAEKLRQVRKNPVIEAACTSDDMVRQGTAQLYLAGFGGQQSSLDVQAQDALSRTDQTIEVRLTTLNAELTKHSIEKIDFLAIDVEGHELAVLAGLNLQLFNPQLVLLEDWARDFSRHRWMQGHGYKLVRRTSFNSWYVPVAVNFPLSAWGRLQLLRKYVLGMPVRRLRLWRHERKRAANS